MKLQFQTFISLGKSNITSFLFIILSSLFLISFFSCSKESDINTSIPLVEASKQNDLAILKSQDKTINDMLYYTSKVLSIMKNKGQILSNKYQESEQIYFMDLIGRSNEVNKFEEKFISEIKSSKYLELTKVKSGELIQSISGLMVSNNEQYRLGISVHKLVPEGKAPTLIAAGFEVDDYDAITAFDNGIERKLTEEQAKEYDGNIFIVQNLALKPVTLAQIKEMKEREIRYDEEVSNSRMSNDQIQLGHYIIKNPYYYEQGGNLELRVDFSFNGRNNNNWLTAGREYSLNRNVVTNSETQWPVDIIVNNIPEDRFTSSFDSDFNFIAYERDWYASKKSVSCSCNCANTSEIGLLIRAKYSYEYYTKECGLLALAWPVLNDYEDMNSHSYKGFFRLWRKQ